MNGSRTVYDALPMPGLLADLVLLVHAAVVAFVVTGLVLFLLGGLRGWRWVRNPWIRYTHLATIGVVVVQGWLGRLCPLTLWEHGLRRAAGQSPGERGFIEYWVGQLIYYDLPAWVFVLGYTVFAVLVVAAWWWLPPRRFTTRLR